MGLSSIPDDAATNLKRCIIALYNKVRKAIIMYTTVNIHLARIYCLSIKGNELRVMILLNVPEKTMIQLTYTST